VVEACARGGCQEGWKGARGADICALDRRALAPAPASLPQFPRVIAGACNSFRSAKVYLRAITGAGHPVLEGCERDVKLSFRISGRRMRASCHVRASADAECFCFTSRDRAVLSGDR